MSNIGYVSNGMIPILPKHRTKYLVHVFIFMLVCPISRIDQVPPQVKTQCLIIIKRTQLFSSYKHASVRFVWVSICNFDSKIRTFYRAFLLISKLEYFNYITTVLQFLFHQDWSSFRTSQMNWFEVTNSNVNLKCNNFVARSDWKFVNSYGVYSMAIANSFNFTWIKRRE